MEGIISLNELLTVIDEMMEMRSRCAKLANGRSVYLQNSFYEAAAVAKMDDDTFERYKQSVIARLDVCHRFSESEVRSVEHVADFFEGKLFKDDGIDVDTWYEVKGHLDEFLN